MSTFFESGSWVWIPDEDEVVLPAKAKVAFRLGERATVILENGAVSGSCSMCEKKLLNPVNWQVYDKGGSARWPPGCIMSRLDLICSPNERRRGELIRFSRQPAPPQEGRRLGV